MAKTSLPRLARLTRSELNRVYNETTRRAVALVKRERLNLVGLLVHGSVARGEPGPFSDIDLTAVASGGKNRRISPTSMETSMLAFGFLRVAELEREFRDPEAFFWARGSANATTVFYDPKKILKRILDRWRLARPSQQILEKSLWDAYHNIIEYSGKLRNGWLYRDEYNTRYAARVIGQYVGRAIIALNEISIVSENYLWHHVLKAKKRPRHLGMDYPVALGIRGTKQTADVYRSALRLCGETLRLIRNDFREKAQHKRFRALLAEPLEKHGL